MSDRACKMFLMSSGMKAMVTVGHDAADSTDGSDVAPAPLATRTSKPTTKAEPAASCTLTGTATPQAQEKVVTTLAVSPLKRNCTQAGLDKQDPASDHADSKTLPSEVGHTISPRLQI